MNNTIKEDALQIMRAAFDAVLPDAAVRRALSGRQFDHPVTLFAIGKAGWRMARAAYDALGAAQVRQGVVITKYQHSEGSIGNLEIYEAAHPVPDENGVAAARRAMDMAQSLTSADTAILLISGGGSALLPVSYWPAARISAKSTACASGFRPSRADALPSFCPRQSCSPLCSATCWGIRWM